MSDLHRQLADATKAWRIADECADRFRDAVCEALGLDENPGDDALIAGLRAHFGKTGPEPTRWRDFVSGAEDMLAERGILSWRDAAPKEPT
jgi:hypothetical protein